MTLTDSLVSYTFAITLLTLTPGLDTALILRTAASEGSKKAFQAAMGVNAGCMIWGAIVALGLGALLTASELAFNVLKWVGAAYLCWLGLQMLFKPRNQMAAESAADAPLKKSSNGFIKGLFGNVLNPKVGVFYVTFLPQFVASGYPVAAYTFGLAMIHVLIGTVWSSTMIAATRPLSRWLKRPAVVRNMDRLTGLVFVAFAVRLATSKR
ncbi:LysE family translocator [Rouxiella badensis]|jgi:threonine/homoserine/homoserine lactone efflux protein|uniref:LysE family translocator n=1 Tax=Rouxiella badensis TaxID=1646377 RepID=UPI0013EF5A71|nr:LysE family translocator [Rouxiella badensis]MCC3702873.1 LysE family translocator [Rouxiella badensis]MCC3748363.1 LysE family translocator [Rouxiella badensis]QII40269.1 LysE family translocator [Rouxiella badensis]QOI56960.1 LysE family translocator [Rouxiella badensis subsp. acadiensis]WAT08347.1 LysE family translocator [Rouxiella badensis]